jgi:hypothetical protein
MSGSPLECVREGYPPASISLGHADRGPPPGGFWYRAPFLVAGWRIQHLDRVFRRMRASLPARGCRRTRRRIASRGETEELYTVQVGGMVRAA